MSLLNAAMYFQNTLIAIEEMKNNESNYSLYIRYILRHQFVKTISPPKMDKDSMGLEE